MNNFKVLVSSVLGAGALVAYASHASAQELPPSAYHSPADADRPSDNTPPKKSSDERRAKNLVYVELLGNGGMYSVNYERMFGNVLSARIGGSYTTFTTTDSKGGNLRGTLITAPVLVNYLAGGQNHKFELGAGATIVYVSGSASDEKGVRSSGDGAGVLGTGVVGYRYSPADGGFVFRVGFTPLVGKGGFLPWGGISFGGTF
jgi:hypothetical protein